MLVTCGFDNVGIGSSDSLIYPTHGRISNLPVDHLGVQCEWTENDYLLQAWGEAHQTRLYGHHLGVKRTIRTSLYGRSLLLHDCLTNYEPSDEAFMLLYHFNFGYPLLSANSLVYTSDANVQLRNSLSANPEQMTDPVDGQGEELYFFTAKIDLAWGAVINRELYLGAYVRFETQNLPFFFEWKNLRSHDYVLALEPSNCRGYGRLREINEGISLIAGYSQLDYRLEVGVLDGQEEIDSFLNKNGT